MQPVQEWRNVDLRTFREDILPRNEPALLKGLVSDWPAVTKGTGSAASARDYVAGFDRGAVVDSFIGSPQIEGRFFYSSDMRGFNFVRRRGRFGDVLQYLLSLAGQERPPSVYIGSVPTREVLPGFAEQNRMELIDEAKRDPRIWVGNRTEVAAHFDLSDNIACVVAGRRRFTVFPPDQVRNLYVGPLDNTMAGQPSSMVQLNAPDLQLHPRFAEALQAARVAQLEPGDAIYIPPLWWHHVQALDEFNILVNYWWDEAPAEAGSAFECLAHGIWAIGHLPEERRLAWRSLFDHYVFKTGGDPAEHLPETHRGILGRLTPNLAARIKHFLQVGLSRK